MKKVTIVVPVFITSCHASLNPKIGPVIAQIMMTDMAIINVTECPDAYANHFAKLLNPDAELIDMLPSTLRFKSKHDSHTVAHYLTGAAGCQAVP
jgi:hypothetical protein